MEEITEDQKKLLFLKDRVQLVINKTEKPNSHEFGKPGNRFKIYFDTADDLKDQIKKIKEAVSIKDEE